MKALSSAALTHRRFLPRWARAMTAVVVALGLAAYALVATSTAAHAAPTLLSQGKTTTASSTENAGTPAADATDGNTGTRWSSAFSDPQWLEVDLGATASVSQVVLQWEAAYATAFQIQTSNDNSTWTSIYSTTTGTGGTQTLNITGTGRYVRMYGTARATGYGYSLWEFQVYGTVGGTTTCGTTNAALNKATTASSTENAGTPAADATDGNTGTRWSSAFSDPQWLQVDLGSTQSICQVVVQWETAYATAFQIQTSNDATNWTSIYSTTTGTGGTQTLNVTGSGRYIRLYATARATQYGDSVWEFQVFTGTSSSPSPSASASASPSSSSGPPPGCTGQSNQPNFGPNTYIFDPSMSAATIQADLDSVFNTQKLNQFGTQRYAELYKPGTYSVEDNVGFYTSVQGLGQNPGDVTINGDVTVDSFDGTGNATQNFWRSAENLTINPSGGSDRWAVAQAGPFRRVQVNGGLEPYPASYGYASGGYIADSKVTGQVSTVSQQQWYSQDSNFGSWAGSVWNMVFSGVDRRPGAVLPEPADDHAGHHAGLARRALPVRRLVEQLPRVPAVAAYQRIRRELGQRRDAGHLGADEPVLRGDPVQHRGADERGARPGLLAVLHPGCLQHQPDPPGQQREHRADGPRLPDPDPGGRCRHDPRGRR